MMYQYVVNFVNSDEGLFFKTKEDVELYLSDFISDGNAVDDFVVFSLCGKLGVDVVVTAVVKVV